MAKPKCPPGVRAWPHFHALRGQPEGPCNCNIGVGMIELRYMYIYNINIYIYISIYIHRSTQEDRESASKRPRGAALDKCIARCFACQQSVLGSTIQISGSWLMVQRFRFLASGWGWGYCDRVRESGCRAVAEKGLQLPGPLTLSRE